MSPTPLSLLAAVLVAAGLATPVAPSGFDAGSDGSFGELVVLEDRTIVLPDDGVLRCTRVTVGADAILRFEGAVPVRLLATGPIVIAGTIDVSGAPGFGDEPGRGGPGGFDGGAPGRTGEGPGAGSPGEGSADAGSASHATRGTRWLASPADGRPHGSPALVPLLGGSGGGGARDGAAGAGGGGAILVASDESVSIDGLVLARGGSNLGCSANHGSGGAIRIAAPLVQGHGVLDVRGGGSEPACEHAGPGRVRIERARASGRTPKVAPSRVATLAELPPRLDEPRISLHVEPPFVVLEVDALLRPTRAHVVVAGERGVTASARALLEPDPTGLARATVRLDVPPGARLHAWLDGVGR